MGAGWLQPLVELIAFIWPGRLVKQWQRGARYRFGRYRGEVGPGVYWVVPWFTEVTEVDVCEAIIGTERLDVTLSDNSLLSFSATAVVQVVDVRAALNDVEQYRETAKEALAAVLADRLAAVDAARLEHGSRKRLLTDLQRWVAEELTPYGIAVRKLRFTSFVLNAKAHRLIVDQTDKKEW